MSDKMQQEPGDPFPPIASPAWSAPPVAKPVAVVQTEDEEIYCPVCNYNLTGIYSGRCPECGSWFDRAALMAAQQAHHITLIPWDDPQPMPLRRRFWQTLRICLVNAERFAHAFSVQPQRSRAFSFSAATMGLTALLGVVIVLLYPPCVEALAPPVSWTFGGASEASVTSATMLGIVCFVVLSCGITTLLAALVLYLGCPHYDGRRHFRPWLSICAYASAHYVMIAAVFPFAVFWGIRTRDPNFFPLVAMMFVAWLGCAMLCGFTLRAVVHLRTPETERTAMPWVLMIPVLLGTPVVNLSVAVVIAELARHFLISFF